MGKDAKETYEAATRALQAGALSADAWVRVTAPYWRRMARRLWDGWRRKLPAWVERADVEQELPLLALKALPRYDARRTSGSAWQFITWSAFHRTGRLLEHWRGASTHGRTRENPSRAEIAFSVAFRPNRRNGSGVEREEDPIDRVPVPAAQEEAVESAERFREVLSGCLTVREALVLLALRRADGSVRGAAEALYGDFAARVECGLEDVVHARQVVGESVSRIAARTAAGGPAIPPEDLFEDETVGTESAESAA